MPKLILIQGNCEHSEISLKDEFTIGRGMNNDLTLLDHNVSRQHVVISRENESYIIRDLSSTNGTIVNGFYVTEKTLNEGDQIQIGKNTFLFEKESTRIFLPSNKSRHIDLIGEGNASNLDISVEMDTQSLRLIDDVQMAKLSPKTVESYRKLGIILDIAKTLASHTEVVPLLSRILDALFKIVPVERGYVFLTDPYSQDIMPIIIKKGEKASSSGESLGLSKSLLDHIKQSQKGVLTSQNYETTGPDGQHEEKIQSVMCVPLLVREQLIGIIGVQDLGDMQSYSPDDLELITAIALQTSLALENIQLTQHRIKGERSHAIDEMVSSIAHEIKNPLSSIQIYTELLMEHHQSEKQIDFCNVILKEIQHLLEITNQVLDYGQYSSLHIENCQLRLLVDEIVQLLQQQANSKGITLTIDHQIEEVLVPIDRDKIKQVLRNILLNALQVTPQNGSITILTTTLSPPNFVRISIHDSGPGIAREYLDQIFKPFFSNRKGGTGLGLAISKRLIEDHSGRITVESELGQGATFHIDLPLKTVATLLSVW